MDAATLDAIEGGADDVQEEDNELVIYTVVNQLNAVRVKLGELGYTIKDAELAYVPKSMVEISDEKIGRQLLKLMDTLEEMDDVTATHSNFDIAESLMEVLA